tara:strand:- start:25071 stop:25460 length:390 start_codon:yes stop_codon:yes gene_type:complete
MNIYGIGTDIVNIKRIKILINKKKSSFKKRIYTNSEIKVCEKRINKIECFAKRFAAKEALFKAIGKKNKLNFIDVEVKNLPSGTPKFSIKGNSLINLKKLFKNKKFKTLLSLSDDKPWAVASVIVYTEN